MRKYKAGRWLFLTFLIIELNARVSPSQTANETYLLSMRFMHQEEYGAAIKALQRVLFFGDDSLYGKAYKNTAECYYALGDYGRAAKYFDLAYFAFWQDSLKNKMILRKSSALILQKNFRLALAEIYNAGDSLPEEMERNRQFLLGIAHFGTGHYKEAEQCFIRSIAPDDSNAIGTIAAQFILIEKAGRLKPKTARILSTILPGAGQFYSGDIKNGLNSLLLSAGLTALFVYVAAELTLLDAFISIIPWFQRYYTGGIKKAGIIARSKAERKKAMAYRNIIDVIARSKYENFLHNE